MASNKFDESYEMIEKIIAILDDVPAKSKDDVFRFLFKAAKESCDEKETYKELILRLSKNQKSLHEYIAEIKPNSNIERSLLFVCFLEDLGIKSITQNHISACYEIASLEEPGNLAQNIRDCCTARYDYLVNEQGNFRATKRGKNFLDNSRRSNDTQ